MLEWTSNVPTLEGWYYFRSKRMSARVIKIFVHGSIYTGGPTLWAEGKSIKQQLAMLVKYSEHAQFAGPIPEPKEAGE